MSLFESGLLGKTEAGKIALIDALPKSIAQVILQYTEFHSWEYSTVAYSIMLSAGRFPQQLWYNDLDSENSQLYDRDTV
jgi:hypothetical protein